MYVKCLRWKLINSAFTRIFFYCKKPFTITVCVSFKISPAILTYSFSILSFIATHLIVFSARPRFSHAHTVELKSETTRMAVFYVFHLFFHLFTYFAAILLSSRGIILLFAFFPTDKSCAPHCRSPPTPVMNCNANSYFFPFPSRLCICCASLLASILIVQTTRWIKRSSLKTDTATFII